MPAVCRGYAKAVMLSPEARTQTPLWLAPVAITPTKPLTPSHVKALLWLDVLYKCTACVRPTRLLSNRRTYDTALQTVGFWHYLDVHYPGDAFAQHSEQWFGARYVEYHRTSDARPSALTCYRQKVEESGWLHASSERLLELWAGYYRQLGLRADTLRESQPLAASVEDVLKRLQGLDCLLDLRQLGAGVYLDLTPQGIGLRQLLDGEGVDNYLLGPLRELLPEAPLGVQVLLLSDEQLDADYLVLQRVLERAGIGAQRLSLGRVALAGKSQSSRHGGWEDYTLDRLLELHSERYCSAVLQLGFRLYFITALGRSGKVAFSFEALQASLQRAQRTFDKLAPLQVDNDTRVQLLREVMHKDGYVDPYRAASRLFTSQPKPEAAALLRLFIDHDY